MLSKEPSLSFIIPVYKKAPEVFERCLEALFDMSVKNIEVIAVFDGADHMLEKVCDRFRQVKQIVIEHGGACKARNEGFRMSVAPVVAFWDADCYAKPEMAKVWLDTLAREKDVDFVYSGYEFANDRGAYDSEPFDAYSLRMGNYVSSMSAIKRGKVAAWDETLPAAQDWDFWLTVVENGAKGHFNQGYGFVTEVADASSISGSHWSKDKREETIKRIRDKHNIPDNKVCFFSFHYHRRAINMAKLCGADFLKDTGRAIENYEVGVSLGVAPDLFGFFPKAMTKVIYWLPYEIECLFKIAYETAKQTVRLANESGAIHFCNDVLSKKKLSDLGIEAEILDLPIEASEAEKELPAEFKVLVDADKAYEPIVKDLARDLPYVKIDFIKDMGNMAPFSQYSLLVSLYEFPTVDESIKGMLINGRSVISNVQAPYCGLIDTAVSHPEFKRELFKRVRSAREYPFNKEAQDYYIGRVKPEIFRDRIFSYLKPAAMEVL